MQTTKCAVTVQSTVNGQPASINTGAQYGFVITAAGDSSPLYSTTPQTYKVVADPSGSVVYLNGLVPGQAPMDSIIYNGQPADLVSITVNGAAATYDNDDESYSWPCFGGNPITGLNDLTFTANYSTRAVLNVQ